MVKVYIPVLPKSPLKYLQIFQLCSYTIIAPFSGKFLKLKKGKRSKDANFAVKKILCSTGYNFIFLCSVN